MKASEIVVILQDFINRYGDKEVYAGGTDYPVKVNGFYITRDGDGYVPKDVYKIKYQ